MRAIRLLFVLPCRQGWTPAVSQRLQCDAVGFHGLRRGCVRARFDNAVGSSGRATILMSHSTAPRGVPNDNVLVASVVMMTALLHHKVFGYGARSCRCGGYWKNAVDNRGRPYLTKEMSELRARNISEDEWQMLLAEVQQLLRDAEAGRLNYDNSYAKGVVCKAQSAHDVLEARLELTVNLDGEQHHLRLYSANRMTRTVCCSR